MISSVVIDDFHFERVGSVEPEAEAPLVVDPDAVPSFPVSLQRFEPIVRGNAQIFEPDRPVQHLELSLRYRVEIHEPSHRLALEQRLGVSAFE